MRHPICWSNSFSVIVCLGAACLPLSAQDSGHTTSHSVTAARARTDAAPSGRRRLAPGTEVVVASGDTPDGRPYVALLEDASGLTVLRLTDPELPRAVRRVLRDMAGEHPDYMASADRRGTHVRGSVRVSPDGVFLSDQRVVGLDELIEHIAIADIVSIEGRGERPLNVNPRPFLVGIEGGGEASFISKGGDLRATFSLGSRGRSVFEGFVGGYRGTKRWDIGVYGFQFRRPIQRFSRPNVEPFASFGFMGAFGRFDTSSCSNATCRRREVTYVFPPALGLVGVGLHKTVNPRLAVRVEAQGAIALFVPLGVRISAGVSTPLGRTTFRRTGS